MSAWPSASWVTMSAVIVPRREITLPIGPLESISPEMLPITSSVPRRVVAGPCNSSVE